MSIITNQLRDEVYAINVANGWHEEKRTFGELIALVHSEVSEALEDYRAGKAVNEVWYEYKFGRGFTSNSKQEYDVLEGIWKIGKPCGIPSELADIVIRILDICGIYGWDIEETHQHKCKFKDKIFGSQIANIHKLISAVYYDEEDTFEDDAVDYLDIVIQLVQYICEQHNIDLAAIIEEKLAYNATRGYKHGGKTI